MSLSVFPDETLKKAVESAGEAGIPIVTSAGNDAMKGGTYPCGYVDDRIMLS